MPRYRAEVTRRVRRRAAFGVDAIDGEQSVYVAERRGRIRQRQKRLAAQPRVGTHPEAEILDEHCS